MPESSPPPRSTLMPIFIPRAAALRLWRGWLAYARAPPMTPPLLGPPDCELASRFQASRELRCTRREREYIFVTVRLNTRWTLSGCGWVGVGVKNQPVCGVGG